MLANRRFFPTLLFYVTSCIGGTIIISSTAEAASFTNSKLSANFNNFQIAPIDPSADSQRNAVAISGTGVATANGDGTLDFVIDGANTFLNKDFQTTASGNNGSYFGIGNTSSNAIGNFLVDANQSFGFNFQTALDLISRVDTPDDGSTETFGDISFRLLDEDTQNTVSAFRLASNINTNLLDGIENDFLNPQATSNLRFTQVDNLSSFNSNNEFARSNITGSFQQVFDRPTRLRLVVDTQSRSCVQSPQNNTPCFNKVPEPNNIGALLFGLLSLGWFSKRANKNKLAK